MPLRPELMGAFVGAICVGVVSLLGSGSDSAEAKRPAEDMLTSVPQPTQRDFEFFEARLSKASNSGDFAKTCGRGEIIANASIHVAMQFPAGRKKGPGFARAHVDPAKDPKALILDSAKPTLWQVTGAPSVIILTGKAVVADYPENTPVFAPRFADRCKREKWVHTPRGWHAPGPKTQIEELVEGPANIYANRARDLSGGTFGRDAETWKVKQGADDIFASDRVR